MKKYCCLISYSGENYAGFQRQKNKTTVQGTLESVLSELCGKPMEIKAAGRTDAGVHAFGQTISLSCKAVDVASFKKAMNKLLPEDIYVRDMVEVDESFDARHSSIGKVYRYTFTVNERDPLQTGKIAQLRRDDFKFEPFLRALTTFSGTHNFQNFTAKPEDKDGFIRTIEIVSAVQKEDGNRIEVTLRGNGFMRYQVRMMIGSAIRVGLGRLQVADIENALNAATRHNLPYKAPAEGLCLLEVLYEHPLF